MRPSAAEIVSTIKFVGELLDTRKVEYCFEGRFRFRLDNHWSIMLSPDTAGRFRLDACHSSGRSRSMWTASADRGRLRALVLAARDEAAVLIA